MHDASIPWLALLALGAAHGINPAMGWLFAVGRGLQTRDRRAVWRALGPLAHGHALAVAVAIAFAMLVGEVLPLRWLRWLVALALLGVGVDGLLHHRHVRLAGMRVTARQLATWSFLMSSAHGAGLMVLPFVLGTAAPGLEGMPHHHMMMSPGAAPLVAGIGGLNATALLAAGIHTLGYLAMTVTLAVLVYEKLGLRVLRKAWINVNLIWSGALVVAGVGAVLL
jgi:hypothetical protein